MLQKRKTKLMSHSDEFWLNRIGHLEAERDELKQLLTANVAQYGMNEALLLSNQRCKEWQGLAHELLTVAHIAGLPEVKTFERRYRTMSQQPYA
jgi:hypothetical protein